MERAQRTSKGRGVPAALRPAGDGTADAAAATLDDSPRMIAQRQQLRGLFGEAAQLRREPQMHTASPVAQRATSPGLKRSAPVIVVKDDDPRKGKTGTVFTATQTGYEVRFGRDFIKYNHEDLEAAVTSELNQTLSWSTDEMMGLDRVAYTLASQYSPNEYAYISLGSSPLLVIEYVRQRSAQFGAEDLLTLLTVPLSEVDDERFLDMVDKILSGDEKAMMEVEGELQNLHAFMMAYVPPQALQGKKPLLIDYAAGGRTLTVLRYHLKASYIYMGLNSLAQSIEAVALNGGTGVIRPSSSYSDLLSMYGNKDKIYELFGQQENTKDLAYPPIPTIDPQSRSKDFLDGLSNRKLKDEFGYRSWNKTTYTDVLKGREMKGQQDEEGIARARRAIGQIINILDHF